MHEERFGWGNRDIGPWPDVATARSFLQGLATGEWDGRDGAWLAGLDQESLGGWLAGQGLAPLAHRQCRDAFPELAAQLASAFYAAAATNMRRFHELAQVLDAFQEAGIPVVLLKGAALAEGAYGGLSLRSMGDVDLWLRAADMTRAVTTMQGLGFRKHAKDTRPPALQFLSLGEVQLHKRGLIELHWSPFKGWWLRRTAAVEDDGVWERAVPASIDGLEVNNPELVRQLSAEDMVIHVALHSAVHSQFLPPWSLRSMMDVALTAQARPVDWTVVAERARRWRVATALWAVLDLAERLIGLPGAEAALARLRPSLLRRRLLARFVSPESVLAGQDLTTGRARYLLLLLLVDRFRDAVRLVFRTLWPEDAWLAARYGAGWSRRHHLWNVVRRGKV